MSALCDGERYDGERYDGERCDGERCDGERCDGERCVVACIDDVSYIFLLGSPLWPE
jgi:hypothetical protein